MSNSFGYNDNCRNFELENGMMKDYLNDLSHKLLFSFSLNTNSLSFNFICSKCFGILFNPLKCKSCNKICCEKCVNIIANFANSYEICICKNPLERNFEKHIIPELLNSKFILAPQESSTLEEISYSQVISGLSKYIIPCLPKLYKFSSRGNEEYIKYKHLNYQYQQMEEITNHSNRCTHKFSQKINRMMLFIRNKGISFESKILCKNDAIRLSIFPFSKIVLNKCYFALDFAIEFAKIIYQNKLRLKFFFLDFIHSKPIVDEEKNILKSKDFKCIFIILFGLKFCKYLKNVAIVTNFYKTKYSITYLYNSTLPNFSQLENLRISYLPAIFNRELLNKFWIYSKFQYLKSIELFDSFILLENFKTMIMNFGNPTHLKSINLNNIEVDFNFKSEIEIKNDLQMIENYLTETFQLEIIELSRNKFSVSKYYSVFFQYLIKSKSLNTLILKNNMNVLNKEAEEFKKFIEQTLCLKKLIFQNNEGARISNIIECLKKNKSIEYLELSNEDLGSCGISKLIIENSKIRLCI